QSVAIDGGEGCVEPTQEAVLAGEYTPFSRPLFIYVKSSAYEEDAAVKAFVDFYLNPDNQEFVADTGYVVLNDEQYADSQAKVASAEVKTVE
ncbi:MAG: phosphate transporter binding protein, partial [Cyanobacteria bacterium J06626_14]